MYCHVEWFDCILSEINDDDDDDDEILNFLVSDVY